MSHWLHCNGCYSSPETVELPFYISSCSHIYCEKCVTPCTKECCKICKSQCTTLMLNSKIPKEVEALFADPVDLHQKLFKQLHQTLEFQKSHQRRLIRKFKEKIKAVERQNNEVRNILMQAQNLEREFMKLKEENHYLKFLLSKATSKYQPFKDPVLEPVHPLGDIQLLPANHSRLERIMNLVNCFIPSEHQLSQYTGQIDPVGEELSSRPVKKCGRNINKYPESARETAYEDPSFWWTFSTSVVSTCMNVNEQGHLEKHITLRHCWGYAPHTIKHWKQAIPYHTNINPKAHPSSQERISRENTLHMDLLFHVLLNRFHHSKFDFVHFDG